jgi:hypothetical protein
LRTSKLSGGNGRDVAEICCFSAARDGTGFFFIAQRTVAFGTMMAYDENVQFTSKSPGHRAGLFVSEHPF